MSNSIEDGRNAMRQQEYEPSAEQQERLHVLLQLVSALEAVKVRYAVAGGYGLDGLYGELTRDHGDIDLVVGTGYEEQVRSILTSQSIEHVSVKDSGADVYVHTPTQTKIEVAGWGVVANMIHVDESLFLPEHPNATLTGTPFRTTTLEGHEIGHELQKRRAANGNWGVYPHERSRMELIKKIRSKQSSKTPS